MNGFIKKTLAAFSLAGGLACFSGCYTTGQGHYYQAVDPCWPQRYSAMASDSVNAAFAAQVSNGHILDQTLWNHHFERGKAELTPGGRAHLDYLARRRPAPDPRIFLQTAYDMPGDYDPKNPGRFTEERQKLDNERIQAVYAYLQAHTAGRNVPPFQVAIHDPGPVGMGSVPMLKSISERDNNFKGVLPITSGSTGGVGTTR